MNEAAVLTKQPASLMEWITLLQELDRMDRQLTPDQRVSCALSVIGLANFHLRHAMDQGGRPGANVQFLASAVTLELRRAVEVGP